LKKNKSSATRTWGKINELLKGKSNKDCSVLFTHKNEQISDPREVANKFNEYFATIGKDISDSIPIISDHTHHSFLQHTNTTFSFESTTEEKVKRVIQNLKNKTSYGVDGLSSKVLRQLTEPLIPIITHLINLSLETGTFPLPLKIAKVVPIFKKNDPTVFDNYRPISLLPAMSKVFERCMADQIIDYFETNKLFYASQYGFRSGRSTELATLELIDRISTDLSHNTFPCCIFMDLSKAFDTINHQILIEKLNSYGFDDNALTLLESYLTNRKQCVIFDNILSDITELSTGIPQGSILGPILFIIYINDIVNCCDKLTPVTYADDTTLYFTFTNPREIEQQINHELKKVLEWLQINKLSLNTSKTKMMVFRKKRTIPVPNLTIDNNAIEAVTEFNFLGIVLDEQLNFKAHINMLCRKLCWSNYVLNQFKHFLPIYILRTLYFTLVHTHLNYGILTWGCNSNSIVKIQKKSLRIISDSKYNAHTSPLFSALDLLTVHDIYQLNVLKFYYKYSNNMLPEYFQAFQLTTNHDRHDYATRQRHANTVTNLNTNRHSLRYQLPNTINNTPPCILDKAHTHTLDTYSSYAKMTLINNYQTDCQIYNCYICNSNRA